MYVVIYGSISCLTEMKGMFIPEIHVPLEISHDHSLKNE